VAACLLHAPPSLAAREKIQATKGSGTASSLLPFPAGGDSHRHLQKKRRHKPSFGSNLLFRSVPFRLLSFPSDLFPLQIFSFTSGRWL